MRKWIIAAVIVMVAVVVVGAAVLNINSLITRNKDYLIVQAEQALGRKIQVGGVEATLWSGLGVRLKDFSMADDPSYPSEHFVRARDLQVNLKLWPLLSRKVQVKRLILHDPVIRVVRNNAGVYNFSTIGGKAKEKKQPGEKEKKDRAPKSDEPPFLL